MRPALFCLIVFASACRQAPDTRTADAKAISEVEAAWVKTAATKDLEAFVKYYSDDASMLTPNAPLFTGKQAIKDELKPMLSDPSFSVTFTPIRIEVAKSGDMAFTQGSYQMTFSDIRGNKFEDEGKYLRVWRKLPDGTWKAVQETMNSNLPLPLPPN